LEEEKVFGCRGELLLVRERENGISDGLRERAQSICFYDRTSKRRKEERTIEKELGGTSFSKKIFVIKTRGSRCEPLSCMGSAP